jgi:hypothetical protein
MRRVVTFINLIRQTYLEFLTVSPLRRRTPLVAHSSPLPITPDQGNTDQGFFSGESSASEDFFTPDLLQLISIECASTSLTPYWPTQSGSFLNGTSRFFPVANESRLPSDPFCFTCQVRHNSCDCSSSLLRRCRTMFTRMNWIESQWISPSCN